MFNPNEILWINIEFAIFIINSNHMKMGSKPNGIWGFNQNGIKGHGTV